VVIVSGSGEYEVPFGYVVDVVPEPDAANVGIIVPRASIVAAKPPIVSKRPFFIILL
jgi:hypothetical protein